MPMNCPSTRGARALLLAAALVGIAHGAGATERGPLRKPVPPATAAPESQARVIVKFKAESSLMRALSAQSKSMLPQQAQTLGGRLGLSLSDGRAIAPRMQVIKGEGLSSLDLADRLAKQADVEYAVIDGRQRALALALPNDPLYAANSSLNPPVGQWYLRAPNSSTISSSTSVLSAINAEAAWNVSTGSAATVVALLDTGVRPDHPDLAPKLRPGYDFVKDVPTAADGDGVDADPSDPGDFGCTTDQVQTSSWHGTQTAGLVGAATNNGIGMASVGRDVMVLPIRALGKCGGFDSDIQAGMLWAAGLTTSATSAVNAFPAKVINLSLGSPGACSQAYRDVMTQLTAAGVVVVAAAGNDGLPVGTPANCPGVIAVAGVRHAGTKVGYSDLGPEISIAAPAGNCVNSSGTCLFPLLTTSNKGTTTPISNAAGGSIYTNGGDDASLGTSFSAPLVAGTVGLMLSANPAMTPTQVLTALKLSARPFPSTSFDATIKACTPPTATSAAQDTECFCTTGTCGAGLLDAGAAVTSAANGGANVVSSSSGAAGAVVSLDGSGSWPGSGGGAIKTYLWTITSGDQFAKFVGATDGATATLQPTGTGEVTVNLSTTDQAGHVAASEQSLSVTAPPPGAGGGDGGGGGGGGGAIPFGGLLGGLAAVLALGWVRPRQRI
jgi:serine protease